MNLGDFKKMRILGADAITSKELFYQIRDDLQALHGLLFADIFDVGANVGLRGGDLIDWKFTDIDLFNSSITILEKKTKKHRLVTLNNKVITIIKRRKYDNPNHVYVFTATSNRSSQTKHITIQSVNRVLNEVGKRYSLRLSTHSMRKTFGAGLYKMGKSLELIGTILNHSSLAETRKYIGLTQSDIKQTYNDFTM